MRRLSGERATPPPVARGLLVWVARLVAAVLVVVVLARLVGLELGSVPAFAMAFLPVGLAASYPLLVGAVLLRQRALSALALALTAVHVLLVAPSTGAAGSTCAGAPLRVVAANVLYDNRQPDAAGATLLSLRPDVLALPELTDAVATGLSRSGLDALLPHALDDPDATSDWTGLRSRYPLLEPELRPITSQREPRATVEVGGVRVRVLGVHPQPPLRDQGPGWQAAVQDLDGELEGEPDVAVALGDFNAGRDLASFRALLDDGVRDAHEEVGRGLARTWPTRLPLLHLDHVLVRDSPRARVTVCDVREVQIPGTDHLAVVADLTVRSGAPGTG